MGQTGGEGERRCFSLAFFVLVPKASQLRHATFLTTKTMVRKNQEKRTDTAVVRQAHTMGTIILHKNGTMKHFLNKQSGTFLEL